MTEKQQTSAAAGEVLGDGVGGVAVELVAGAILATVGLGVFVTGEVLHVA